MRATFSTLPIICIIISCQVQNTCAGTDNRGGFDEETHPMQLRHEKRDRQIKSETNCASRFMHFHIKISRNNNVGGKHRQPNGIRKSKMLRVSRTTRVNSKIFKCNLNFCLESFIIWVSTWRCTRKIGNSLKKVPLTAVYFDNFNFLLYLFWFVRAPCRPSSFIYHSHTYLKVSRTRFRFVARLGVPISV